MSYACTIATMSSPARLLISLALCGMLNLFVFEDGHVVPGSNSYRHQLASLTWTEVAELVDTASIVLLQLAPSKHTARTSDSTPMSLLRKPPRLARRINLRR